VVRARVTRFEAGNVTWPGSTLDAYDPEIAAATGAMPTMSYLVVVRSLKGSVVGQIQVISGLGMGDCGVGTLMLGSLAMSVELELELLPVRDRADQFTTSTCRYIRPIPRQ